MDVGKTDWRSFRDGSTVEPEFPAKPMPTRVLFSALDLHGFSSG